MLESATSTAKPQIEFAAITAIADDLEHRGHHFPSLPATVRGARRSENMTRIGYSISDLQAAGICGHSKAYELIAQGKLKKVKIGRKTIVTAESVQQLLADAA